MGADEFIYCPQCGSSDLRQTDYENMGGEEDTDGRECNDCGWEGDLSELVCKSDDEDTVDPDVPEDPKARRRDLRRAERD